MEIVAMVPMRHESERVPGKNRRQLGGSPLFHHILRTLQRAQEAAGIRTIVVDTDSEEITSICRKDFPEVAILNRPSHLRDARIPMTEILRHDAEIFPSKWYLQTHATNPFLSASSIVQAVDRLDSSENHNDSLFTVTRLQARLFTADARSINHDPDVLIPTQDLEPVFIENSNLYLFTDDQIRAGRRYGSKPLLYELPPLESLDIDEGHDFALAEALATSGFLAAR